MTCIIVDDEASARKIIRKLCSQETDLEIIAEFENAMDALRFLNREAVDLAFLDIHMPAFSGFDLLETIRKPLKVVLTTSDEKFALESYEYVPVVDYLVKPITAARFSKALEKVRQHSGQFRKSEVETAAQPGVQDLYVNIDRRLVRIRLDDILVVEAQGDYILLKTEKEITRVHTTLKSLQDKLPEDRFLQVHRSFVINYTRIVDIEDNSAVIGKNVVPISRAKRPELMKRINLL